MSEMENIFKDTGINPNEMPNPGDLKKMMDEMNKALDSGQFKEPSLAEI